MINNDTDGLRVLNSSGTHASPLLIKSNCLAKRQSYNVNRSAVVVQNVLNFIIDSNTIIDPCEY